MMSPNKNGETLFEIGREHSLFWWCFSILWFIHQALSICWMSLSNFNGQRTKWQIYTFGFCHLTLIYITIRDESELSSAQIQLELARLVRFSARLGSKDFQASSCFRNIAGTSYIVFKIFYELLENSNNWVLIFQL